MILVDTSVWINLLRKGNNSLEELLGENKVTSHPLIIGELHIGNINKRKKFLSLIRNLPQVEQCTHEEVLYLIEKHKLFGKGIGYTDAQLLCSSIVHEVPLWTLDKKLDKLAKALTRRWS